MQAAPAPTAPTPRPSPRSRVVVLGASNVRRGLPCLVSVLEDARGAPLDLLMATGHGRSYGMASRVFGRTLPAILASGLWPTLAERPPLPTVALVTDVGNDILYGAPAEVIVAWVREAVGRLQAHAASIVLTGLPLAGIDELGTARYLAVRSLLFPRCRVTLAEARQAAHAIDDGLRGLAEASGATFVEPEATWYGLDPIHVRRRARARSWTAMLAPLAWGPPARGAPPPLLEAFRLRLLRPAHRRLFGVEQVTPQPAGTSRGGTRLSMY